MSDLNKELKLLRLSGMILTSDVVSMVDDKEHNTAETTPSILCEDACDDFEYMYMMLTLFKKSLQQYSSVERKPQYRPVSPDMYIYTYKRAHYKLQRQKGGHSDERGHATLQRYYLQCFKYSLTVLE